MSGAGKDAPSRWQRVVDAAKDLARPYVIAASGTALAVSVFVPSVTPEKMLVLAGVAGGVSWLHGKTKEQLAAIAAGADTPAPDGDK